MVVRWRWTGRTSRHKRPRSRRLGPGAQRMFAQDAVCDFYGSWWWPHVMGSVRSYQSGRTREVFRGGGASEATMIEEMDPELIGAILAATPERVSDPKGFDAIVVGAGAAGGLASLLLTEAGMSVLLLDAGWQAYLGRRTTSTRNCAGTMSSRSLTSSPIR